MTYKSLFTFIISAWIGLLSFSMQSLAEETAPVVAPATGEVAGPNHVIDSSEIRTWAPLNIPTTDPHYNDAVRCLTNLDQKLRQLIDEGNRAATSANATSTTGPQSLDRVIRQQADLSMLRVARAFLRLREQMQSTPLAEDNAATTDVNERAKAGVARLRTSSRTDSATAGIDTRLVEGIKGTRSTAQVSQTLFEFYDYIQSNRNGDGSTATQNPFQDPVKRRDLLRSLQLYSYKQEPDNSDGRQHRFEIEDRDVYVVDKLFNFYQPSNAPTTGDGNFMDTIMGQMVDQFRSGTEAVKSDFNAIDRQIKARYDEHKGGGSGAGRYEGNSDENYTIARDRFRNYIKDQMSKFIKKEAPYQSADHGCDHFYTNGRLKAEYRNKMCGPAAVIEGILSNNIVDDFTPLYNFLRPPGSPPLNVGSGTREFQPEMHAKRMYSNLMSCRVEYNSATGNWEACLQLYVEHGQSTEAETNWFVNTGQELDFATTSGNNGRLNCNRGGRDYAYQTSSTRPTYTIATENCISTPLHMNGRTHDHVHSPTTGSGSTPNGCAGRRDPRTQLWVNLGDTFQSQVHIMGTQGAVTRDASGNIVGPRGETTRASSGASGPSWRNEDAISGDEPLNYRTLDLASKCAPSVAAFQAGTGASTPTTVEDLVITPGPAQERSYSLKAQATPNPTTPRRGTYRWNCASTTATSSIFPPTYQNPTATPAADQGPCQRRTTTENSAVTRDFAAIKEFAIYPRLRDAYSVKVKYYSTVQAPSGPEKTAVIPPFVSFKLVYEAAGNGETRMRAVPIGIDGLPIAGFLEGDPAVVPPNESEADRITREGKLAARRELTTLLDSGTIRMEGCATRTATSPPVETCTAFAGLSLNSVSLFSSQGVTFPTPVGATPYNLTGTWTETATPVRFNGTTAARAPGPKSSEPFAVAADPYSLSLARSNESPENFDCTPTFTFPSGDSAAAGSLRWVCTSGAPTEGANLCPTSEATTNPVATTGTAKTFSRTNRTYQVTAYANRANGEVIRSNTCEITERGGDRVNVAIAPVAQANPLRAHFTVSFTQPAAVAPFPGTKKITCPDAPDGASCKVEGGQIVAATETSVTLDLPVPINGTAYNIVADYTYTDTRLGVSSASQPVSPLSLSIGWDPDDTSVEGEVKIRAKILGLATGQTIPADQITVFTYHTDKTPVPTPPGSADVDKRSAMSEFVSYKRFSSADGGAYTVIARATIGGQVIPESSHPIQSNDMTLTITATPVNGSPANIFRARARVSVRPATATIPAGATLKWFCDGPGKPENCDKNVNVTGEGSDDFPRNTENHSYTITAKLMPATGTESLAEPRTLTVDPVPAATFRITAEDRKTNSDPKTDFIAKVFNSSETAEYRLATGETIRWAWKDLDNRDQTATGATLATDRKARDMSGKVSLQRGETKVAETDFTIDAKDSCRQRSPAGNCLDREPEEEEEPPREPIVLPDVAPNGAAPPNFIPITLPPRGGMQLMRGFN